MPMPMRTKQTQYNRSSTKAEHGKRVDRSSNVKTTQCIFDAINFIRCGCYVLNAEFD